ncbi:MAG TPA: D-alanyl-D-alanine carboxypeptidase family protein [Chloroflexota bacterium]|nr:D-alanyl-D-alanine carboxypeptidase family protein [Chloroflexota bacterium]
MTNQRILTEEPRRPLRRNRGTAASGGAVATSADLRGADVFGATGRAAYLQPPRVVSPRLGYASATVAATASISGQAVAASRSRRRQRTRHVEWALAVLGGFALSLGACALRPQLAGPGQVTVVVSNAGNAGMGASGGAAPSGARGANNALVSGGAPVVVTVMGPPLAFSFARFEADPALVAGAGSAGVPNLSGESAIVIDVNAKEVLYAKNPRKRQLPASTTKMMTALVAMERSALDKVITVPEEATKVEPNHMGIRTGEKLTVQELLYGLMLDSGNDAAEAIAYGVGGGGSAGRAQFIAWMNEKVAAFGLSDTKFANPSGLDDPQQYSTAYDLAVIGAHALKNPELRKIFSAKEHVIAPSKEPGREHGWFGPGNLNSLLSTYRGAVGIKPGYTEDAGYTLVAAAERDGRTLVAVTLNSRRHFTDCALLMDFGFSRPAA